MKFNLTLLSVLFLFSPIFGIDHSRPNSLHFGLGSFYKRGINTKEDKHIVKPLGFLAKFKGGEKDYLLRFGYEYFQPNKIYSKVDVEFKGYQSNKKTVTSKIKLNQTDIFYYINLSFGYTFDPGFDFLITPHLGLGMENSKLKFQKTSTLSTADAYVAREWTYMITGLNLDASLDEKWDIGIHIQIMTNLQLAKAKSNIEGVLDQKLNSKVNYTLDAPITYAYSDTGSSVRLVPFYGSQNFSRQKGNSLMFAATYKSYTWGARFEYVFRF